MFANGSSLIANGCLLIAKESQIATRLRRYVFILVATYFALIGGTYYDPIFAVRVFQHLFVTGLLGVWLIARLVRRRGLPPTPLNPLLYAGVVVWIVSALLSLDPRMALENLWFPLTNLLLFFVLVDVLQSRQENLLIETQFLLAALIVVLAGAQFGSYLFGWGFGTPRIGWLEVLGAGVPLPLVPPRLYVPIGVSTWLAAYTAPLALLAGVGGLTARRRNTRVVLWILAALLAAVMLLTGSRGGWISLGAGVAAFVGLQLLRSERARQLARRYVIPLGIVLALGIAGGTFVLIRQSSSVGHASGDILRFDLWRGALTITADHPVLGVGAGLFGSAYRLYRDPAYVDNRLDTAHNLYLNSLAETGVLGALVGLALIGVLLRRWWALWRGADTPARQLRLAGALAALIGFGAQSFFDTFTSLPLVLLALGLVAYCVTEPPRSRIDAPPKGSIPAAVASLILLLVYGAGLIRSDQAQAAFRVAVSGSQEAAAQAVALDPSLRLYTLQAAYLSGLNDPPEQAIPAYESALNLAPTWDMGWINLAALRGRQGDTSGALDALQRAIAIDEGNGALLLWAQLAEEASGAPPDAILDAYRRYFRVSFGKGLPLSSYWTQTDLRQQALAYYEQISPLDLRYRVVAAHDPSRLAELVPENPVSAEAWWVVGQYALTVEGDAAKADAAFTQALAAGVRDGYLGDYYASRARARVTTDLAGALRDLKLADLLGTLDESTNATRALLAATPEARRAFLAAAVPPQIIDQNFEGTLFGGRGADFRPLPEMRLPGPGRAVMQPWYDLAADYLSAGSIEQAANVYHAILDRAPDEDEARAVLEQLAS